MKHKRLFCKMILLCLCYYQRPAPFFPIMTSGFRHSAGAGII
ncbi:hypothetical protein HS9_02450 [Bacillus velezensis]|nr:hypothetical protein HS9_02450 [Bacillus velezensis]